MPIILVLLGLVVGAGPSTRDDGPKNVDVEKGQLGKVPTGWFFPAPSLNAGFTAKLVDDGAKSGERCVVMERGPVAAAGGFGNLMQAFDAQPFRGKRVTYRAAVRTNLIGAESRAQLWMRVDRAGNKPGFFDNMGARPISSEKWADYEIIGEVADDAETINIGVMLHGRGRLFFDAASFEVIGGAKEGVEPPRPLEPRAIENLVAFTRLFGYVRHFHPSNEAATADWNAVASSGVAAVERAENPAELARVLDDFVRPLAPTVRVFESGAPPQLAAQLAAPANADSIKLTAWKHRGVGIASGPMTIYSSQRESRRLTDGKIPEGMPDPQKPFTADLGGGVSCLVPLALYADSDGTLPRGAANAKPIAIAKPKGFHATGNDRTTRLAAVVIGWNYLQHFYPYFDVAQGDWPAALRRALAGAATDADEREFLDTLRRLVAGLHDGHGRVGHASDSKSAALPLVWDWVEEQLVITHFAADAKDQARPGDVVLAINGRTAADAIRAEEELISSATPQWQRFRAVVELLAGERDEAVTLAVRRGDGAPNELKLKRSQPAGSVNEPRPQKIAELRAGTFYLDVDRITDSDFNATLPKLEKATGIIFDLRGYPRQVSPVILQHLIDDRVQSAQWHVPLASFPDRDRLAFVATARWNLAPLKPRLRANVAFVTDGRAISYAESLLGIVEHYQLGAIVGGPTAGTNGNVNPFTLPGGYTVAWTGMKVLKHDGSRHHGVGIQPTVPATRTIRGVREGRDELLERAVVEVNR